jgi:hypothetical protein
MNKTSKYLLAGLVFVFSGCGISSVYFYNDGVAKQESKKDPSVISIFAQRTIEKDCIELGPVAVANANSCTGDELKQLLRETAAEMGADAVINFKLDLLFNCRASGIAVKYK